MNKEFRVDDVSDEEWLNMTMDTLAKANGIDIDAYILAKVDSNPLFKSLVERVERFERLDLVEVVRCKDCKHYYQLAMRTETVPLMDCDVMGMETRPDDFCSRGERK